ncbi:MAG TPA: hypothetical protein ENK08_03210 [Chloroflexi bacterium]|nr:hypothetical protein [Chloroflexota bacterium]
MERMLLGVEPDDESDEAMIVDMSSADNWLAVATCCEPLSGAVYLAALPVQPGAEAVVFDQGSRVDLADGVGVVGDQAGYLKVFELPGRPEIIASGLPMLDVAVSPAGDRLFVLVSAKYLASIGVAAPAELLGQEAVLTWVRGPGSWSGPEVFAELPGPGCRLAVSSDGRIAVLEADNLAGDLASPCVGNTMLVLRDDLVVSEIVIEGEAFDVDSAPAGAWLVSRRAGRPLLVREGSDDPIEVGGPGVLAAAG